MSRFARVRWVKCSRCGLIYSAEQGHRGCLPAGRPVQRPRTPAPAPAPAPLSGGEQGR